MVFDSLEGCRRERERYQKTSKMKPKSIRQSMKNRYKKHVEQKHAEIMKQHQKMSQKGRWNQYKTYKKGGPQIDAKKNGKNKNHVYFGRAFGALIGYKVHLLYKTHI